MPKRIRATTDDPRIPAWTMDFDTGQRYRFVRPEAAAELVSLHQTHFPMRQPDPWELEALGEGKRLTERGAWIITRISVFKSEFA